MPDMDIAFSSAGVDFCKYVKNYSPLNAWKSEHWKKNNYENLKELCNSWSKNIEQFSIDEKIKELIYSKQNREECESNNKKTQNGTE